MPNPAELASQAERAANQLRDWLIDGPAQQADGGVAGVVNAAGRCRYVYGEITGYYLHWLAQARSADPQRRRERAAAALSWVEANYHATLPPTRIQRIGRDEDWRNAAQFLFDLAMLAGGMARAARAGLIAPDARRLGALAGAFDHFIVDGQLRACLWLQPERAPLPRWSTAGGPFLAKAASRALMAEAMLPFAPAFSGACRDLLRAVNTLGINSGVGMLHPTLYAMEGAVADHTANEAALRRWLATVLALQDTTDGSLPETPGVDGAKRSDVIAQALRLGVMLDLARHLPDSTAALTGLASALIARVRDDGIAFDPARESNESNVWCAMFAEQALRAHAARLRDEPLPFAADEIV